MGEIYYTIRNHDRGKVCSLRLHRNPRLFIPYCAADEGNTGVAAEPIYVQTLSVTGNSANDFTITSESDNVNISNISEPIDIPESLEFISTAFENSIYITKTEIFPTENKIRLSANAAAGDFTLTSNDITFNDPILSSPASLLKNHMVQSLLKTELVKSNLIVSGEIPITGMIVNDGEEAIILTGPDAVSSGVT